MSIQIKNLTSVLPRAADGRMDQAGEPRKINRIPLNGKFYDLYVAPGGIGSGKAAIVKIIRIINTYSSPVFIDLYYTDNVYGASDMLSTTECRRRRISPPDILLPEGFIYIDQTEITVDAGARIQASARPESDDPDETLFIDYLVSGVEQESL